MAAVMEVDKGITRKEMCNFLRGLRTPVPSADPIHKGLRVLLIRGHVTITTGQADVMRYVGQIKPIYFLTQPF